MLYPGIPSIAGQMAFSFITNDAWLTFGSRVAGGYSARPEEKIEEGGAIRVGYPTQLWLACKEYHIEKCAVANWQGH